MCSKPSSLALGAFLFSIPTKILSPKNVLSFHSLVSTHQSSDSESVVVCLLAVCQSYLRYHFPSTWPAVLQAGLRVTCSSERGAWDQALPWQEQFQEIRICTLASMGVGKEGWSLYKGLSISLHTSCIPCNGLRQLATFLHFIIFYF